MCLIDFHSGLLSKGPEERAGIVITIFEGGTEREPTPQGTTGGGGDPWGGGEGGPWQRTIFCQALGCC